MFTDDDLQLRLHEFMDREVARSRPASIEAVQDRGRRRRRLTRLTIAAVAASLLVIVGATLTVVAHRPPAEVSAASDNRVEFVVLPGSGSKWVAFAMHNALTTSVRYTPVGVIDRRRGSAWEPVDYFDGSRMGGTRPGPVTHNPPSSQDAVALIAGPGGLGPIQWIDVSSLSPGTYRLRQAVDLVGDGSPPTGAHPPLHPIATAEFRITDRAAPQAPPLEADARIEPSPAAINGAAGALALELAGSTSDLSRDIQLEQSLSLTVHIRKWEADRWADVTTRQAFRIETITTGVALPRLSPGLYELTRTLPSGRGAISGWLFVTRAVRVATQPKHFVCRVSLGQQSKAVVIKPAIGAFNSVAIEGYTAKFTMLIPPTNGFGFMRAEMSGPTPDFAGQSVGGIGTRSNAFTGEVPTPKGAFTYACGA